MNGEVQIDIDQLANCVKKELQILQPLSNNCCIYRAPDKDKEKNEKVYTPRLVSIGPLHHGKEKLEPMEDYKRRYLFDFLEWSDVNLEDLLAYIKKNERRLRDSYAEPVKMESEKFVKMMLVDSAFIISLLLKKRFPSMQKIDDRVFGKPLLILDIRFDIILMENQIPFFILIELFELSSIASKLESRQISIVMLTHCFFEGRWGDWVTEDILELQDFSQVQHILDFLRICQKPRKVTTAKKMRTLVTPTIAELHNASVKFELHSSKNQLEIEFDKKMGILKIPHFQIFSSGETETLLRNLVTFEKCHYFNSNLYVNDYKFMLARLVRSGKDVEILDQSGIIENWLDNNQAAADLLGSIDATVDQNAFYFSEIVEGLNEYYKNRWHK